MENFVQAKNQYIKWIFEDRKERDAIALQQGILTYPRSLATSPLHPG